ncbi:unnamed protein product [Notodromas monacha]|uniref:Retinoblastoma-like protein 1 n=1 Tax=Notodromas monacha TaxID=399045 RepID=A0A7R9G9M1_9CRUS|nr:unnamed protein product [Notodromas monacha]CAG0914362.1 unnamed protein product [Notodromas monacha]
MLLFYSQGIYDLNNMKTTLKGNEKQSDSGTSALQNQFRSVAKSLKASQNATENAFRAYLDVNSKYVLEGEPMKWLACSLYFHTPNDMKGPHVNSSLSLANLLITFNSSFGGFMKRCENWTAMNSLNAERMFPVLKQQYDAFIVSKLIFRSYDEMFWKMFVPGAEVSDAALSSKLQDSKNARKKQPGELKKPPTSEDVFQFAWGLFSYIRQEEGNCLDIVSSNTLLLVCIEYIIQNVVTAGYTHLLNRNFDMFPREIFDCRDPPALLEQLCNRFNSFFNDARGIRSNGLIARLSILSERETLKLDRSLMGCLNEENIAWNVHGIFAVYYESNEKMRGYDDLQLLRLPRKLSSSLHFGVEPLLDSGAVMYSPRNIVNLTQRRSDSKRTAENVANLQNLLNGLTRSPSDKLLENLTKLSNGCDVSLETKIDQIVQACVAKFREHHGQEISGVEAQETYAIALYYKVLEGLIADEKSRLSDDLLCAVLNETVLHFALVALCFELVLYCTHDVRYAFPWILNSLSLPAFHFFKVIELMIRVEPDLSHLMVSHLKKLEEQILESMAWMDDSPLWEKIYPKGLPLKIPTCADAFLPGQLEEIGRNIVAQYQQIESKTESNGVPETKPDSEPKKSTRNHTSVEIFFRKFYYLAYVRLNCFNELLEMKPGDLVQRTWTCFEHAICNFTQIMRGRHMDQILMCCIYVMCKVTGEELRFEDIMRCYRTQRNAASMIYRSVLIRHPGVPVTPVSEAHAGDRGDIIQFYNEVFVDKLGGFAQTFFGDRSGNTDESLQYLSPRPRLQTAMSPRKRVSKEVRLYVSPYNNRIRPPSQSPGRVQFQLTLDQRLPSKNVKAINDFVQEPFVVAEGGNFDEELSHPFRYELCDFVASKIKSGTMVVSLMSVCGKLHKDYVASTPKRLKIIDAYLLYVLLTGILQFVYCCLVGTFPFNSFLSGFISTVGCFSLAVKEGVHGRRKIKLELKQKTHIVSDRIRIPASKKSTSHPKPAFSETTSNPPSVSTKRVDVGFRLDPFPFPPLPGPGPTPRNSAKLAAAAAAAAEIVERKRKSKTQSEGAGVGSSEDTVTCGEEPPNNSVNLDEEGSGVNGVKPGASATSTVEEESKRIPQEVVESDESSGSSSSRDSSKKSHKIKEHLAGSTSRPKVSQGKKKQLHSARGRKETEETMKKRKSCSPVSSSGGNGGRGGNARRKRRSSSEDQASRRSRGARKRKNASSGSSRSSSSSSSSSTSGSSSTNSSSSSYSDKDSPRKPRSVVRSRVRGGNDRAGPSRNRNYARTKVVKTSPDRKRVESRLPVFPGKTAGFGGNLMKKDEFRMKASSSRTDSRKRARSRSPAYSPDSKFYRDEKDEAKPVAKTFKKLKSSVTMSRFPETNNRDATPPSTKSGNRSGSASPPAPSSVSKRRSLSKETDKSASSSGGGVGRKNRTSGTPPILKSPAPSTEPRKKEGKRAGEKKLGDDKTGVRWNTQGKEKDKAASKSGAGSSRRATLLEMDRESRHGRSKPARSSTSGRRRRSSSGSSSSRSRSQADRLNRRRGKNGNSNNNPNDDDGGIGSGSKSGRVASARSFKSKPSVAAALVSDRDPHARCGGGGGNVPDVCYLGELMVARGNGLQLKFLRPMLWDHDDRSRRWVVHGLPHPSAHFPDFPPYEGEELHRRGRHRGADGGGAGSPYAGLRLRGEHRLLKLPPPPPHAVLAPPPPGGLPSTRLGPGQRTLALPSAANSANAAPRGLRYRMDAGFGDLPGDELGLGLDVLDDRPKSIGRRVKRRESPNMDPVGNDNQDKPQEEDKSAALRWVVHGLPHPSAHFPDFPPYEGEELHRRGRHRGADGGGAGSPYAGLRLRGEHRLLKLPPPPPHAVLAPPPPGGLPSWADPGPVAWERDGRRRLSRLRRGAPKHGGADWREDEKRLRYRMDAGFGDLPGDELGLGLDVLDDRPKSIGRRVKRRESPNMDPVGNDNQDKPQEEDKSAVSRAQEQEPRNLKQLEDVKPNVDVKPDSSCLPDSAVAKDEPDSDIKPAVAEKQSAGADESDNEGVVGMGIGVEEEEWETIDFEEISDEELTANEDEREDACDEKKPAIADVDWSELLNDTRKRPGGVQENGDHDVSRISVKRRLAPGRLFAEIGVSAKFASASLIAEIKAACLAAAIEDAEVEGENSDENSKPESFEFLSPIASFHSMKLRELKIRKKLFNFGRSKQGLSALKDFQIRRFLTKAPDMNDYLWTSSLMNVTRGSQPDAFQEAVQLYRARNC